MVPESSERLAASALGWPAGTRNRKRAKRPLRHRGEILAFLDYPDVPFENDLAERMIRPAVVLRKDSQSKRFERGAAVQAVMTSIYQTLKLRGP